MINGLLLSISFKLKSTYSGIKTDDKLMPTLEFGNIFDFETKFHIRIIISSVIHMN